MRIVSGASKPTLVKALEAETYVTSISSYLLHLQANSRYRLRTSGQANVIAKTCEQIAIKIKINTAPRRTAAETPGQRKTQPCLVTYRRTPSLPTPKLSWWEELTDEQRQRKSTYRSAVSNVMGQGLRRYSRFHYKRAKEQPLGSH